MYVGVCRGLGSLARIDDAPRWDCEGRIDPPPWHARQIMNSIDLDHRAARHEGYQSLMSKPLLEYRVLARRTDANGSLAKCKDAEITLDTALAGRNDAFNPAELLLAALAACIIKGIERVTPLLKFDLRGVEVAIHAVRQDVPPKIVSIDYELIVDTDEDDRRLELLHTNVRKFGTISNTLAQATELKGRIRGK